MDDEDPLVRLVRDAAAGDQLSWNQLVDRYAPLVMSVVRRHRLREADAQDVFQTVWLRLVEHLGELREPRALPGWIASTTRHECLRTLAACQRAQPVDAAGFADMACVAAAGADADVDDGLVRAELHEALIASFAELPERHRALLYLLVADPPLAYEEISARLHMPVGSIGPTRARALARVRSNPMMLAFLEQGSDTSASRCDLRGGGRDGVAALGQGRSTSR